MISENHSFRLPETKIWRCARVMGEVRELGEQHPEAGRHEQLGRRPAQGDQQPEAEHQGQPEQDAASDVPAVTTAQQTGVPDHPRQRGVTTGLPLGRGGTSRRRIQQQ